MSLDLDFDDGQLAIQSALGQFCEEQCDDDAVKATAGSFPHALWSSLAELGVLGVATPEGEGGPLEVVAAMESLGRAAFPGPLVETIMATLLFDGDTRAALAEGRTIVSAGRPPLLPWALEATLHLELVDTRGEAEGEIHRLEVGGSLEAVDTLGGERWGKGTFSRRERLAGDVAALRVGAIAHAAYQAALGRRLVEDAAAHAAARTQFGKPIGDFQAVSHPLADAAMTLDAAALLARAAAERLGAGFEAEATGLAASARLSADRAALEAAYVAHQVYGAIGITIEGPAFHITRRIRQLAARPGGEGARATLLAAWDVDGISEEAR